ncbi:MAG: PhoH family protein [Bacteroidetes bacterium]|nr:PhoH family protein [Bacteroidota bacterium]MBU1718864.1 PhoH family protein [Bacteroidota bacterium]
MRKERKIFVLDTSVIIYDHNSFRNFMEHDVAIPITVLEELDNFKKGHDTKNYSAREFIRIIDNLSEKHSLQEWIALNGPEKGKLTVVLNEMAKVDAVKIFGEKKPDHKILNAALYLQEKYPSRKVVLVTKDINLRVKAKSLNLNAEDYLTGKVKEPDSLFTGKTEINDFPGELIDEIYQEGSVALEKTEIVDPAANSFYILKNHKKSILSYFNPVTNSLEHVKKNMISRISPRNAEQTFAIHAIMNPNVNLVTIQGVAGTGKTLLSLAGALEQRRLFHQIYLARPIVPLSNKDIGFLPGDINSKIGPYMEPLWDNLKFIKNQFGQNDKEYKQIEELVEKEKLIVSPLAYIRGRSFSNILFIVDEAQNLTPHEVKTIITRAGEGTKMIFTGDIFQIDTPYLDTESNGLSYLIDRIKNHPIYAHITLEKGERSELANIANSLL